MKHYHIYDLKILIVRLWKLGILSARQISKQIPLKRNKNGMTLLEVVIALILFTFMAISLTRLTNSAIKYRKRVTQNTKITKFSRNVLQIIRKDIRNIFYTQDMNSVAHISFRKQNPLSDLATPQPQKRENQGKAIRTTEKEIKNKQKKQQLIEFEITQIEPYMLKLSTLSGGITGTENSLRISSLSYTRNQNNEQTSDQNLIVYYLKPCKSRDKSKEESSCLWRKFSTMINQKLSDLKYYDEFVLLEKMKTFQVSYYNMYSNEWKTEWKTGPNDKNILPSVIRIKIEFENKKKTIVKQDIHLPLYQQVLMPTSP